MKNIFQIWEENNRVVPFCVSKGSWSDERIYVVVQEVIPNEKGYGVAYGIPVTEGIINTYFDYNRMWKTQKKIPNAGVYNWIGRPNKSLNIIGLDESRFQEIEGKEIYGLQDKIPFGKLKGKTIKEIIELSSSYLDWALKNVQGFRLTDDVLLIIKKK